jgi:hypothetical protein
VRNNGTPIVGDAIENCALITRLRPAAAGLRRGRHEFARKCGSAFLISSKNLSPRNTRNDTKIKGEFIYKAESYAIIRGLWATR